MSDSSRPHGLQPTRLLRPWDFPGKSTGVGCHCLLRHQCLAVFQIQVFHLLRPSHTVGRNINCCSYQSARKTVWRFLNKLKIELPCYCCYLVTTLCLTLLQPQGLHPTKLLCPRDFPGKNTGVGCHFLLWEIFLTQGSNLHLLHCRWILYY